MIATRDIKELVTKFGSHIALYNEIKHVEFTTSTAVSISYIIQGKTRSEDKRYLIHVDKLKAKCFDEILEQSFDQADITFLIEVFHTWIKRAPECFEPNQYRIDIINRAISLIKLLKK